MATEWNGNPIQHMDTGHLINACAYAWRMMMHKKVGIVPMRAGEFGLWDQPAVNSFMESHTEQETIDLINSMTREIHRRRRAA